MYPHFGQLAAFPEKHTSSAASYNTPPWTREAANFAERLHSVMSTSPGQLELPAPPTVPSIEDKQDSQEAEKEVRENNNIKRTPSVAASPEK